MKVNSGPITPGQVSFLLGFIPTLVAWVSAEILVYKRSSSYSKVHSDSNLVELGNESIKEDDRAVLLEGGLARSASQKSSSSSVKSNLIRFVTMDETFLMENRLILRAINLLGDSTKVTEALLEGENRRKECLMRSAINRDADIYGDDAMDRGVVTNGLSFPAGTNRCESSIIIKVDAMWKKKGNAAVAWIVYNNIHTGKSFTFMADSLLQAEALGIREALLWAREVNLLYVSVHTDCLKIIDHLHKDLSMDQSTNHSIRSIIQDLFTLGSYFRCLCLIYVPRSEIAEAHNLARSVVSKVIYR